MKLSMIKDFDEFYKIIDGCNGRVELVTGENDRLNLKSKLSQYVSFAKIFSNGKLKNEIEIVCYDSNDVKKLMDYMIGQ